MIEYESPFDNLGIDNDQREVFEERNKARDRLIHRVFRQTEAGRELLEQWTDAMVRYPTASHGDGLLEVGIAEGRKSVIRDIILTCERVEQDG